LQASALRRVSQPAERLEGERFEKASNINPLPQFCACLARQRAHR
jgi:hypothetical protein